MYYVTSLHGFTISLSLDPVPSEHFDSCNYGGDIDLVFIRENNEDIVHHVSFVDFLGLSHPEGFLDLGGHLFGASSLMDLESKCWLVLYKHHGIYPAVFRKESDRKFFKTSQSGH